MASLSHYIDLPLRADPEFSPAHLMSALMGKLHRALVQRKADGIGISFPQYSVHPRTLGHHLRLHGTSAALEDLMAQPWLQGMRDHVQVGALLPVPPQATHCLVERRQFKTSADRLRRRRMRRKGETQEQAMAAIPDTVERRPDLPFVQVRSSSTGQPFSLFIAQQVLPSGERLGAFNAYGLGLGATVPWF